MTCSTFRRRGSPTAESASTSPDPIVPNASTACWMSRWAASCRISRRTDDRRSHPILEDLHARLVRPHPARSPPDSKGLVIARVTLEAGCALQPTIEVDLECVEIVHEHRGPCLMID